MDSNNLRAESISRPVTAITGIFFEIICLKIFKVLVGI